MLEHKATDRNREKEIGQTEFKKKTNFIRLF